MLSTKGSYAGMMSAAVGMDRSRVGERLQAALAGLQELHLLRDRQGDMVSWALGVGREETLAGGHHRSEDARMMGAEEQRLEATLTALKQQLSRLRKQDVGLKTHLQQLDQQISELKLDVSKASTEQLESDSRPSSGFYELSDAGSCSLSNSCTSVYSECLSSSQTSLLLPTTSSSNHQVNPALQAELYRRRSADEGPGHANPTRGIGLHLGSSRIRGNSAVPEVARPRPVSTGDLDKMMTQGLIYKQMDGKKQPLCPNRNISTIDPKFQSNLMSRNGVEMYHYPSPLHAVALQSTIFFQAGESDIPGDKPPVSDSDTFQCTEIGYDTNTLGYIDKLLQRSSSKTQIQTIPDAMQTNANYDRKPPEVVTAFRQEPVSVLQPPLTKATNIISIDNAPMRDRMPHSGVETTDNAGSQQSVQPREASYGHSYPAVAREYSSDEVMTSSLRKDKTHVAFVSRGQTENPYNKARLQTKPIEKKVQKQRPVTSQSSSAEDSQVFKLQNSHMDSPKFVHAKFLPAGTQRIKVRQADRKTKAIKLRRKSVEKPRAVRQLHSYSSGERTRESCGTKAEPRRTGKGKPIQKYSCCPTEELKQSSCSDSSQCSPGVIYPHKGHPKPHLTSVATKPSKTRRTQCGEYEHPVEQRKKKQLATKWLSDGENFQRQRPKEPYAQTPMSMHLNRGMSTKWIAPHHPFMPSISSNSFNTKLNARYPPAPYHMSSLYPPRCESEYSAECMSVFHSTIAPSSDGEMSDNTTNRFGDSESSQSSQSFSDSDSSLSMEEGDHLDGPEEEGDLVWAEASVGPTVAGKPLQQVPRPEPPACRIKASRALKKKIRRFQPASLKVMTLV
ncbi:dapper homolog 2 [Stigmatopora nigra]